MEKLWAGRAHAALDKAADDFNSSIAVDSRMYRQDIRGSMAHAAMLAKTGMISAAEGAALIEGLGGILADLDEGRLAIDPAAEDIHSFVEAVLTERLGDTGRKLHTARSRNDQVALDTRLYLRDLTADTIELLAKLVGVLCTQAEQNADAVMPGYTHLQRAQPITFAHQLLAYGMMFSRDIGRLSDAAKRMNVSPLGACALAGTTHPIDRQFTASQLGFDGICHNSLDAVSDRDFCVELSDAYTTGSSIMPQKKNSDMAELVRGKTGRVYGDLITLLTMLKGLPLAYNKDMQEDKEAVFDAFDTVNACLGIFAPMLETMTVRKDNMLAAAKGGFINATDLADWLARRGVPFRTAYKLTGEIVAWCIEKGKSLEDMTLEEYRGFSEVFDESLYEDISLAACVAKRTSEGGASPANIAAQIEYLKQVTA